MELSMVFFVALVFIIGYVLGNYTRMKTKIDFYKAGLQDATEAIQKQLAYQMGLPMTDSFESVEKGVEFKTTRKDSGENESEMSYGFDLSNKERKR